MKNAILCVASSIVLTGSIIFITALEGFLGIAVGGVKGLLLLFSIGLVVTAAVLFVVDVLYSLHAIKTDIET
jgi:hypothetical protein